jgi:hypothetical protein
LVQAEISLIRTRLHHADLNAYRQMASSIICFLWLMGT